MCSPDFDGAKIAEESLANPMMESEANMTVRGRQ